MPPKMIMVDYAKINTQEKFNWGEAFASALILPALLIIATCFYAAWA